MTTFEDIDSSERKAVCDKFADFLKHGSLYQRHRMDALPKTFKEIVPDVLQLYCDDCERENPFRRASWAASSRVQPEADIGSTTGFPKTSSESAYTKDLESRVYVVVLQCKGCNHEEYTFWIEIDKTKSRT